MERKNAKEFDVIVKRNHPLYQPKDPFEELLEEIVTEKELFEMSKWGIISCPTAKPEKGRYYDLIKVPHGHIPVSQIKLWSKLLIPIKAFRGYGYFRCPECDSPSFFRLIFDCGCCGAFMEGGYKRFLRRQRRRYFKGILKRLESLILPILVFTGKAYYVRSERTHWSDKGIPNYTTITELRKHNIYYTRPQPPKEPTSMFDCDHYDEVETHVVGGKSLKGANKPLKRRRKNE